MGTSSTASSSRPDGSSPGKRCELGPSFRGGVQLSWKTVHRVLKRPGFVVHVDRRPDPLKRFPRRLVDSLWQADVSKFRIVVVRGHVYLQTTLDHRARCLVMARAYHRERAREAVHNLWWATNGEREPKALYVDSGSCFIARAFRNYCERLVPRPPAECGS